MPRATDAIHTNGGKAASLANLRAIEEKWAAERLRKLPDVLRLYGEGFSVNAISKKIGFSRGFVNSCLADLGIKKPTVSEGNVRAAAKMSGEERKQRAKSAHETVRRFGHGDRTREHMATVKRETGQYIGLGETDVLHALEVAGIICEPQAPWEGYNVDIMAGHLAVEIHNYVTRPLCNVQQFARAIDILSSGKSLIYLWYAGSTLSVTAAAIDEIVAFHHITGMEPSALGQYRVIRGDGQIDYTSSRNFDKVTAKLARYASLKVKGRDL